MPSLAANLKTNYEPKPSPAPHLIVIARAGTGKTTTLVCGLQRLKGDKPHTITRNPSTGKPERLYITPSPQQEAVWSSIELSRFARTVCFVAFNKSIAEELKTRVPAGCEAMTMHSLGFKAVTKAYGQVKVNSYRVCDIISEILEVDIRNLRRDNPTLIKATEELAGLCKMNLVHPDKEDWAEELDRLASYYDVDLNNSKQQVFDLVPKVLDRCRDVQADNCIDFNDMIWLPIVNNLPVFQYDLLLWDEVQDGNRCQQALAKKAGRRLILVGDPAQSVYGFAGADSESMSRMERDLIQTEAGVHVLPLTVTRRCGKAIVERARSIVPDFEAHESNVDGLISEASYPIQKSGEKAKELPFEQTYMTQVKDGDMVLCRCNAPLVSQCFRFLKLGRRANIQGRDVGQGLISTVKKMKANSINDLTAKLSDWHFREVGKENAKRNPSEAKLISLEDRYSCICCFMEGAATVDDVIRKIETIFTDNKDSPGIKFSSVHRAKGLEADRVFLLLPQGASMPHPMAKSAWQVQQEMNILYVAVTRAKKHLVYVY